MIENVSYTANGTINATIDGEDYMIPDLPGNRFRSMIAEWEAEGNTIAPYEPPASPKVVEVSRRQFMMQLELSGLKEQVDGWVAAQPPIVQIAYRESATFRRDEPMLIEGFQGLNFTESEIDAFYSEASKI